MKEYSYVSGGHAFVVRAFVNWVDGEVRGGGQVEAEEVLEVLLSLSLSEVFVEADESK